jgi:chemotaxis protein MotB
MDDYSNTPPASGGLYILAIFAVIAALITAAVGFMYYGRYSEMEQQWLQANLAKNTLQSRLTQSNQDLASSEVAMAQQRQQLDQTKTQLIHTREEANHALAEISSAHTKVSILEAEIAAEREKYRTIYNELNSQFQQEILSKEIEINQLRDNLTIIHLNHDVLFNSGKTNIHPSGHKTLDVIAKALDKFPKHQINILGHTDNVPISLDSRHKFASNWELSALRATAVVRYLQENNNIAPNRMSATGYGEYRPIQQNRSPLERSANRRIEIVLMPSEDAYPSDRYELDAPANQPLNIGQEENILAQNPEHFTVQILGTHNEELILNYILENQLLEKYAGQLRYFKRKRGQGVWYELLLGSYPSLEAANKQQQALPDTLKNWKPWIRRYRSVHQVIAQQHNNN